MVKRIAIFGAESTGKSTLAEELAAHFGEPCVPEYVREFWDEHEGKITADDLGTIARVQMETEDTAATRAQRILFCDTDLLTNVLWADLLYDGKCPDWVRAEADTRCHGYDLYLLCDTDIAFVPDPQRSFPDPEGREMCRQLWRQTLVSRDLPFVELKGDQDARRQQAIAAVERVLSWSE
jgi:HTH-type transcriptional regulator, transcriptional repressor of NAD biosynthesis genes